MWQDPPLAVSLLCLLGQTDPWLRTTDLDLLVLWTLKEDTSKTVRGLAQAMWNTELSAAPQRSTCSLEKEKITYTSEWLLTLECPSGVIFFFKPQDFITFWVSLLQPLPATLQSKSKLITRTCTAVGQDPSRVSRLKSTQCSASRL